MDHRQSQLSVNHTADMGQWLRQHQISLAFSTYQAGKLFFVGSNPDHSVSLFERDFARCMGIGLNPDSGSLWVASRFQLWRFENALLPGQNHQDYDALYIPQMGYTTGNLDTHDVAVDDEGPVFVNTRFNCLARPSDQFSFTPVWRPSFISQLVPEDRCHLNGLALQAGQVKYVSAFSISDQPQGWRQGAGQSGIIVDVEHNELVSQKLHMPHSPRWHQGRLWVLNSGTGELGHISLSDGRFEPLVFCPGYLRGLGFIGHYAIVGTSRLRLKSSINTEHLRDQLKARNCTAQCSILVINLNSGSIEHQLLFENLVEELYDVCVLPDCFRPMALGFKTAEIEHFIALPPHT